MNNQNNEPEKFNYNQNRNRFAFELLRPQKGKFFYHVITTTISLFVITIIFTLQDYGKGFTFMQGLKLSGLIFVPVTVIWSIAYLFYKVMKGKDREL